MKLVRFRDGKYGVRHKWYFFNRKFIDLHDPVCAYKAGSRMFRMCKGTRNEAIETMNYKKGYHDVVLFSSIEGEEN